MRRGEAFDPIDPVRAAKAWLLGRSAWTLHAALFAAAAVALTLLNVALGPEHLWFWQPLLAWGVLLAAHAWLVASGGLGGTRSRPAERVAGGPAPAPVPAAPASDDRPPVSVAEPVVVPLSPVSARGDGTSPDQDRVTATAWADAPASSPAPDSGPSPSGGADFQTLPDGPAWLASWPVSSTGKAASPRSESEALPDSVLALWRTATNGNGEARRDGPAPTPNAGAFRATLAAIKHQRAALADAFGPPLPPSEPPAVNGTASEAAPPQDIASRRRPAVSVAPNGVAPPCDEPPEFGWA